MGNLAIYWFFQKKKKKQIIQKDVLCTTTTTIISFTIQDLQTNVSIFKHKRKKKEIKKFIFYIVNVEQINHTNCYISL